MKKSRKKQKNITINIYKYFSIVLLIIVLFLGVLYKVNGQNNYEKSNNSKKEIINPNVVFLGDSITDYYDLDKYYPDLKKVNSGIAGHRTWDIKKDMYNRVYRYNPSKVILLIGINNFVHEKSSVDSVVDDIKDITKDINKELPNTEIIIQSIYPINDDLTKNKESDYPSSSELTKKIIDSNDQIKKYCHDKNYKYVDLFKELSDDNCKLKRKYSDDGIHPNEKGYDKITETLKKYL